MPSGKWFATMVGMPMPRFTSIPGFSSRAIRRAMMVCGSMPASRVRDEVVDNGSRSDDMVRRYHSDRNDVVSVCNYSGARHRHHWIEIPSSEGVAEIAHVICQESLHQGEIGAQCGFD